MPSASQRRAVGHRAAARAIDRTVAEGGMSLLRGGDDRLASVSLYTAQVDFSEPGEIILLIDEAQVHVLEAQMGRNDYFSADQMASAFQMLRSYGLPWSRAIHEYLLGDRRSLNDPSAGRYVLET